MSRFGLTPFFPRWFDDLERSHSLFGQFFGQSLMDDDLITPPPYPYYGGVGAHHPALEHLPHHHRHNAGRQHGHEGAMVPFRPGFDRMRSGLSKVVNDKQHFKVNLDVHQFRPEEVIVKTVDNYVIIEGKHQEQEDEHGYIERHFIRKYLLPDGVKPENVSSSLSADGVLTIHAPKQLPMHGGGERLIPISHSPFPAIHHAVRGEGTGRVQGRGQQGIEGEPVLNGGGDGVHTPHQSKKEDSTIHA
jgi:crystallin alpha B